jgi:selenide, water dikinase
MDAEARCCRVAALEQCWFTMASISPEALRLTAYAHGGGCGCKLAPSVLQSLMAGMPQTAPFANLLVGTETSDDAAVWQVDANTAIIATTDFFTPIVDDPRDFGRIAATNAISDVYAMGGKPIFALAILGMPLDKLPVEVVREILAGGAAICAEAGIPVAGGHSIDVPEPIYGLAVIGLCHPSRVRRNAMAKAGDAVILTKPLGVGIYSAALKKGALAVADYAAMLATTTRLNKAGAMLAEHEAVHAMTDVTGFGLLGHGLEVARGSGMRLVIDALMVPFLPRAKAWAGEGFVTGASRRNWASYGEHITFVDDPREIPRHLLTDPQTSGGLLVTCAAGEAADMLACIHEGGDAGAAIIGHIEAGEAGVEVRGVMEGV